MISLVVLTGAAVGGALVSAGRAQGRSASAAAAVNASAQAVSAPPVSAALVAKPQPPTIAQALESGVLIVISKASQRMQVFKDGASWLSSPVSTGRRGHGTPSGVFPILEKQRFHRSNLYSNAPMPFMQRLTMGGIALHAGYVPGHPASHGCIRLPYTVARALFGLTRPSETTVVIMNEAMQSDEQARRLALAVQPPKAQQPAPAALAYAPAQVPNDPGPAAPDMPPADARPAPHAQPRTPNAQPQTIQLAAALSPQEAEARWSWLVSLHSELGRFDKAVVPVVVGSRRYFRLRASGPGAFTYCSQLKSAGLDCFRVLSGAGAAAS
jgi:lipoprotein-anchoring transpeptidase ErfK/SrfK